MIIKIFSDYCESNHIKKFYENICNSNDINFYGIDKEIFFTDDDNYTHALIINCAMPSNLNIPKKNVIGIAHEPYQFLNLTLEFISYAINHIGKYYIGDIFDEKLPKLFIEHHGFVGYSVPSKPIIEKNKILSIIVTNKMISPGHIYRHSLLSKILLNNFPIDVYGNGSHIYKEQNEYQNIKGKFENIEPYEDYLFTIAIENFQSNHYFSEKITSPMMCSCMTIYLGCKNIHNYIKNYIILTGNINQDIQIIYNILLEPLKYYSNPFIPDNVDNVNIIKNIKKLF
jgi:hypothetical protein